MQQYDNKRKRQALRFFTYGVMTVATIGISVVCILLVLGFRFDLNKGQVVQGGLLQFRSFPSSARIIYDGKEMNFRTPGKYNVDAGTHRVTYQKNGYREWSKSFSIDAGELRWLNYARLIPQSVTTTTVKSFPVISSFHASPDRKWALIGGEQTKAEFTLVDLRDPKSLKYTAATLPVSSYTDTGEGANGFSIVEWDFGARYVLVKHTRGPLVEYLRFDRTKPNEVVNITKQFNLPITDLHFSGTSGNVYYGQVGTDIRKFDLQAGTVSEPLISDVVSFQLYKTDTVAYVTRKDADASYRAGVYVDDKAHTVRTYDQAQPVSVAISSYFDRNYLAVSRGTAVEIIKDPEEVTNPSASRLYGSLVLPQGVAWLQFNNSGRFVVAGSGTHFVTYDIETAERFATQLPGDAPATTLKLQWIDDFMFTASHDGKLRTLEFDGGNQQIITDSAPGYLVTLNDEGTRLYSIAKNKDGTFSLQSSRMTTED